MPNYRRYGAGLDRRGGVNLDRLRMGGAVAPYRPINVSTWAATDFDSPIRS